MPAKAPPVKGKPSPLPRGGGMPGGIKGEEQDDDEAGGRKKAAASAENDAALGDLDALSLAEFNRWLITEANWASAEECRQAHIEGEQFRKARDDRHRERGQLRQQDTVEQMKEAKTRVDAHRRQNLELGSAVKRDVIAWNVAKHEEKEAWAKYAKDVKAAQLAAVSTAVRDELLAKKKAEGEAVKAEVAGLAMESNRLKAETLEAKKKAADIVRKETADSVIDSAKKTFFLQRKGAAKETTTKVDQWNTERNKQRKEFLAKVAVVAERNRGSATAAKSAREALLAQRREDAAGVREQKASLDAGHRQQTELMVAQLKDGVNQHIVERFVAPEMSRRMLQHPHFGEVSAVVADVTSPVSREIAASPKRTRRPNSAAIGMTAGAGKR